MTSFSPPFLLPTAAARFGSGGVGRVALAAESWAESRRSAGAEGETSAPERFRGQAPPAWPSAPGPAQVLPDLPAKSLKIVCLVPGPNEDLVRQVRTTCRDQAEQGLKLSSTFHYDGSVFLVFKRL